MLSNTLKRGKFNLTKMEVITQFESILASTFLKEYFQHATSLIQRHHVSFSLIMYGLNPVGKFSGDTSK